MLNIEIAEIMETEGKLMEFSQKVKQNIALNAEDKEIASVVDAWAKEIGSGKKDAYELAQYIVKVVEPEVFNAPDEILDTMFERGSIGEFDNVQSVTDAKNTLNAIESAKNGNVDKSYIDYTALQPTWRHLQIETEVSMEKLRKGGYKTVADLTTFAEEAFKNKMFYMVFNAIDTAITAPSAQGFTSAGSVTLTAADDASGYLLDRGQSPLLIGLSTLVRPMYKMTGYDSYLSENMKNELNKYGILGTYNGVRLVPVSAAKKLADGSALLPANRLVGVADKIGVLDMKGAMRALQTPDNNREVISLKLTGFEFGYALNMNENACKIAIS
jgi:hypothetical protein